MKLVAPCFISHGKNTAPRCGGAVTRCHRARDELWAPPAWVHLAPRGTGQQEGHLGTFAGHAPDARDSGEREAVCSVERALTLKQQHKLPGRSISYQLCSLAQPEPHRWHQCLQETLWFLQASLHCASPQQPLLPFLPQACFPHCKQCFPQGFLGSRDFPRAALAGTTAAMGSWILLPSPQHQQKKLGHSLSFHVRINRYFVMRSGSD